MDLRYFIVWRRNKKLVKAMAKKKKIEKKKPVSKEYIRGLEKADKLVQEAIKSDYDSPEHLALALIRAEIVKSGGSTFVPSFPDHLDKFLSKLKKPHEEIGARH